MSRSRDALYGDPRDPYAGSRAIPLPPPGADPRDSRTRSDPQRDVDRQPPPPATYRDDGYGDPYYTDDPRRAAADAASRRATGGRQPPAEPADYYDDRGRDIDRSRDRDPAVDRGRDDEYGAGDRGQFDDNKLLTAEMEEMAGQMDALRSENEEMRLRLVDVKKETEKRAKEYEEMKERCKKYETDKGRGGNSAELEKLRAEVEKKAKLIDKLMSERNEDADVEDLKDQLHALQKENDKLKKSGGGGGGRNEQETNKQLEKMASTLKAKDQLINEINEEKDELMALLEDDGGADKYKKLKKKSKEMKSQVKELKEANENLEAELASLREELEMLRADGSGGAAGKDGRTEPGGKHKKGCPHMTECNKKLCSSSGDESKKGGNCSGKESCPKDLRPLQELVREQEAHIMDLQREVDTLRHAINDYQKELERVDPLGAAAGVDSSRLPYTSLQDRKAGLMDRHREDADSSRELEQTRRKLRSSSRRVQQLEKWLDEIYNDKNFEIVVKGSSFKGRRTTLSLPEIPAADTARKGPPTRRQYLLAKGAEISAKQGKPIMYN